MAPEMGVSALSTEFADLHLKFARRVAEVVDVGLVDALQQWTPAARLCGPAWSTVRGGTAPHVLARAYRASEDRKHLPGVGSGCFSCAGEDGGRTLRLHFTNREGRGVLKTDRLPSRRRELAATLRIACAQWPAADRLRCGSWRYHLPTYRSLFPPQMLATGQPAPVEDELTFLALWGQFVRADGTLRAASAGPFRDAINQARDKNELLAAFPLPKLTLNGTPREVLEWLADA